jgi:hypothetical protein
MSGVDDSHISGVDEFRKMSVHQLSRRFVQDFSQGSVGESDHSLLGHQYSLGGAADELLIFILRHFSFGDVNTVLDDLIYISVIIPYGIPVYFYDTLFSIFMVVDMFDAHRFLCSFYQLNGTGVFLAPAGLGVAVGCFIASGRGAGCAASG